MSHAELKTWPAMTVAEAYSTLTAPGTPFEMETLRIGDRTVRAYKHGFPHLRAVFEHGLGWGSREYLVFESERLTFDAHGRAVAALARVLHSNYGVRKGDRIAIAMRNFPEWSIAFWAGSVLGAVVTPLNAWGTASDLQYGISDSGSTAVFLDGERLERLLPMRAIFSTAQFFSTRSRDAREFGVIPLMEVIGAADAYDTLADPTLPDVAIAPDDDATIFYTSGTTGRPKGALGTQRNIVTNIMNIDFGNAFTLLRKGAALPPNDAPAPQKTGLLPAPFFHVTGCHSNLVPAMAKGRKIVLMHKWNAERALELIEREGINTTSGVPSMAWQLLESPQFSKHDLSSIEGVSYGGAAASPELTLRVVQSFPRVLPRQAYGATETSSVSTAISGEDFQRRPASVGTASPVCDVRIMRADGAEANIGESGEIWIAGPNVVKGYWNRPSETAVTFCGGWYRTGDIGRLDEEGFVYVLDRLKDMLIRGGENIYCVEIESVLYTHPAILEAAVVGIPHRVLGEEVGAVVQLKPGRATTESELRTHVAASLALHKVPVAFDIRESELPKNASGKVLKRIVRDELIAELESRRA